MAIAFLFSLGAQRFLNSTVPLPVDFIIAPDITDHRVMWDQDKDPSDIDIYPVNAKSWLLGNAISSVTYIAKEGSNLIVGEAAFEGDICRAMVSEGDEGSHHIEVTIKDSVGRQIQRDVGLRVRNR